MLDLLQSVSVALFLVCAMLVGAVLPQGDGASVRENYRYEASASVGE